MQPRPALPRSPPPGNLLQTAGYGPGKAIVGCCCTGISLGPAEQGIRSLLTLTGPLNWRAEWWILIP